jgi:type II secretory pathway component GspD/PulD (secretin)
MKTRCLICAVAALLLCAPSAGRAQDDNDVKSIPIGFSAPDDAVAQARALLSPKGTVVFNRSNSTIVVVDHPENIARIEKMFREQPAPQQVRIEVQFRDLSEQDAAVFGFNTRSRTRAMGGKQYITTISGGTAYISVGEEVAEPYWFYEYGWRCGYVAQGTVWRNVGSRLLVQPVVSGNLVRVTVVPEISFFDGKRKRSVQYRNAATTVTCASGQSIPIGGAAQTSGTDADEFNIHFFRSVNNRSFSLVLTPYILNRPAPRTDRRQPPAYAE